MARRKPFTADDVVFTHRLMAHPKTPSPYRRFEAANRSWPWTRTRSVRYKEPYQKALTPGRRPCCPRHRPGAIRRHRKLREAPQNFTAAGGDGPLPFREIRSGEKIVVAANPDYFAGPPHIARIVYGSFRARRRSSGAEGEGIDAANLSALQYTRQTAYPAFRKAYNKFRYAANV